MVRLGDVFRDPAGGKNLWLLIEHNVSEGVGENKVGCGRPWLMADSKEVWERLYVAV